MIPSATSKCNVLGDGNYNGDETQLQTLSNLHPAVSEAGGVSTPCPGGAGSVCLSQLGRTQ